ncbi:transketolase family protein [Megamonas funiformis]|jgi:transketolase|uniref:transketolase family protein n=3 Tax=Megamonas funiformis TaxID=437897 RepID=UPI00266FDA20|nr:transketolase C-terminal domain-containing protein [Megamonas funiformis]
MNVRDAYFSEIYKLVKNGEDIVIVSADLGAPSLDDFRKDFPHRFINIGIAEQNLLSVASGIALTGKHVIAWGLNPFPVTRAFDQMRVFMQDMNIPLTVVALNAGSCSAECGYTHMPIEDIAMVRTLSNIRIVNPSDEIISKSFAQDIVKTFKPTFIRFDKYIHDKYYDSNQIKLEKGFVVKSTGSDVAIITNGIFVNKIHKIEDELKSKDIRYKLIDCFCLPVDEKALIDEIRKCKLIITIEDNVKIGGLGSMILEILSDNQLNKPVKRLGLEKNGRIENKIVNREYWYKEIGLTEQQLLEKINSYWQNYKGVV